MIYLYILHFIADFILQSREMGQKKSTEFKWLAKHLGIQFIIFFIGLIFFDPIYAFIFATINSFFHGIIDWNIWKFYKLSVYYRIKKDPEHNLLPENKSELEKWQYWKDHLFYTTIGFDQMLHMITLQLTSIIAIIIYTMLIGNTN